MNFEFVKAYFWNRTSCFFNHSHNHTLLKGLKARSSFSILTVKVILFCLKEEKKFNLVIERPENCFYTNFA